MVKDFIHHVYPREINLSRGTGEAGEKKLLVRRHSGKLRNIFFFYVKKKKWFNFFSALMVKIHFVASRRISIYYFFLPKCGYRKNKLDMSTHQSLWTTIIKKFISDETLEKLYTREWNSTRNQFGGGKNCENHVKVFLIRKLEKYVKQKNVCGCERKIYKRVRLSEFKSKFVYILLNWNFSKKKSIWNWWRGFFFLIYLINQVIHKTQGKKTKSVREF